MSPNPVVRFCRRGAGRLKRLRHFIGKDAFHPAPRKLTLLRRGFCSFRADLYPFDRYDWRWFLSDYAVYTHCERINPPLVVAQMTDKLYFHLLLRQFGLGHLLAPLIGTVVDGRFTAFGGAPTLQAALDPSGALIAKPIAGSGGAGIGLVHTAEAVPAHGAFLLEGVVKPHPYGAAIFPGAVNTIRLMTLRPRPGAPPFLVGAGHRFGVSTSAPVDNFSSGGIVAGIQLETGMLTAARSAVGQFSATVHTHHPDTGAAIEGVVIPQWEEVRALALDLAERIAGLKVAGWDICLTPEGPRLIEGNGSCPHPELLQIHRPILLQPEVRRFYAEHGVISRARLRFLDRLARPATPASP